MRTVLVLLLLCAARIGLQPQQAAAAGNPHNFGTCTACHLDTPRFGVDATRSVTFTTGADDPGLCAPCHPVEKHLHPVLVDAGSGPPGARRSTYFPAGSRGDLAGKIVCRTCHFVHAGETRYVLLRGFPGSPDPRYFASVAVFCEECHGGNLVSRSAHAGGPASCVFCHTGMPRPGRDVERPSGFRERCELCHRGVKEEHFAKLTPFGKRGECLLCHDRHGVSSASPGLLSEGYRAAATESVVVRPHFQRNLCLSCHTNTDDYALRSDDVNALCDRCHSSGKILANIHPLRKVPPSITVPKGWPLVDGALTCLTCHEQGHEDQQQRPWLLRGGPYAHARAACRNCHSMKDLEASRIHQEINEGRACEMCHKTRPRPGTDTIKTVDFIASPDLLCLRCHDQSASDGTVHHTDVMGREIEDGHIPAQLPLVKGRVVCATCHNPHLLDATNARLREALSTSDFCVGCHKV
jgi:predicted CXXCH cytochrome family protein